MSSSSYWLCTGNKIMTGIIITPASTHSISGLKSRVLKLISFSLKMMVKSGLEFILKLTEPLQRYLLTCQANSALLGRFFCTGQQQLWRGSVNFKINSRPLFTIIFKLKNVNFKTRDFSSLIELVLNGVNWSMYNDEVVEWFILLGTDQTFGLAKLLGQNFTVYNC